MKTAIFIVKVDDSIDPKALAKEYRDFSGVQKVKTITVPAGVKARISLEPTGDDPKSNQVTQGSSHEDTH